LVDFQRKMSGPHLLQAGADVNSRSLEIPWKNEVIRKKPGFNSPFFVELWKLHWNVRNVLGIQVGEHPTVSVHLKGPGCWLRTLGRPKAEVIITTSSSWFPFDSPCFCFDFCFGTIKLKAPTIQRLSLSACLFVVFDPVWWIEATKSPSFCFYGKKTSAVLAGLCCNFYPARSWSSVGSCWICSFWRPDVWWICS
jgi:hypothetical protein